MPRGPVWLPRPGLRVSSRPRLSARLRARLVVGARGDLDHHERLLALVDAVPDGHVLHLDAEEVRLGRKVARERQARRRSDAGQVGELRQEPAQPLHDVRREGAQPLRSRRLDEDAVAHGCTLSIRAGAAVGGPPRIRTNLSEIVRDRCSFSLTSGWAPEGRAAAPPRGAADPRSSTAAGWTGAASQGAAAAAARRGRRRWPARGWSWPRR